MTVRLKSFENRVRQQTKLKQCRKCGQLKPLKKYHRDSSSKDGRRPRCRQCRNKTRGRRGTRKRCSRCGEYRRPDDFNKHDLGRRKVCASCRRKQQRGGKKDMPIADWRKEYSYNIELARLPHRHMIAVDIAARITANVEIKNKPDWWDDPKSAWEAWHQAGIEHEPYGWICTLGAYYYGVRFPRRHVRSQGQRVAA